jgi:hypothetical protein
MPVDPRPFEVREIVLRIFQEMGISARNLLDLDETILIDAGSCVARTFRLGGLMAMWFVSGELLQFYDSVGNMIRTVPLADEIQSQRMAA